MEQTESISKPFNTVKEWDNFLEKIMGAINKGTPDDVCCHKGSGIMFKDDMLCVARIETNIKGRKGYRDYPTPTVSIHIINSHKACICGTTKRSGSERFLACDITKPDEIITALLEQREKTGVIQTFPLHINQANKTHL